MSSEHDFSGLPAAPAAREIGRSARWLIAALVPIVGVSLLLLGASVSAALGPAGAEVPEGAQLETTSSTSGESFVRDFWEAVGTGLVTTGAILLAGGLLLLAWNVLRRESRPTIPSDDPPSLPN